MSNVSNVKKTGRPRIDAVPLSVRVPPNLLRALDDWIAEDAQSIVVARPMTRPEALRRLAADALIAMGKLEPPRDTGSESG